MIFPKNYNTRLQPSEPINQKSCCETVSDKIKTFMEIQNLLRKENQSFLV